MYVPVLKYCCNRKGEAGTHHAKNFHLTVIAFVTLTSNASDINISQVRLPATSPSTTSSPCPPLRIMPLGDSITWGEHSSTGNGYRQPLLGLLLTTTSVNTTSPCPFPNITYVGTQASGTMSQPANEGWPGYRVAQIATKARASLPVYRPNLVLLMAGTNDVFLNDSLATAPQRLSELIDTCLSLSPDSVVVVAELTPFADAALQAATEVFNAGVRRVVQQWVQAGAKVVGVDMQGAGGVEVGDLTDGEHPGDAGYAKMAAVWYRRILEARGMGWIEEPATEEGQVVLGAQTRGSVGATGVASVVAASSTAVSVPVSNGGDRLDWCVCGCAMMCGVVLWSGIWSMF